jgi:uncharacterized SAM-binding protein YcdF (DUF218 family)
MLKLVRRTVWLITIIIVLIIAAPLFIGWYLSPQDVLEPSDAIVTVSGGDTNSRIEKTVELYTEGWAPVVIFSGAAAEGEVSNAEAMKNIAVKQGIPATDILIEEYSQDTEENAEFSADIIKKKEFSKIILVTSPYHQRRTYELFKEELPGVTIINQSALDEDWRKKGWWENNVGRFLTVGELGKIFVNFFSNQIDEVNVK